MNRCSTLFMSSLCVFGCVAASAAAEDQTLDLMGGYLFGFEEPLDKKDPEIPAYLLDVPMGECLRITNGTMIGGLRGWWDDYITYDIVVDGELVFGEGFPSDPAIYFFDETWMIDIRGTLRIESDIADFTSGGFSGTFFEIAEDAELILEPNAEITMRYANMRSDGLIRLGPSAGLRFVEGTLWGAGSGRMIMESGSWCSATIVDQHIEMHAGSSVSPDWASGVVFELPLDGAASISPYSSGVSWGRMNSVEIVIPDVPAPADVSDLVADDGYNPLITSTITLQNASGTSVGSADRVLNMNCVECEGDPEFAGNTLVPPPDADGRSFVLRWGTDGLYVLTVPTGWCQADLNFDGTLDIFDVFAFLENYNAESPWANFTLGQDIDIFDVFGYLDAFSAGCP